MKLTLTPGKLTLAKPSPRLARAGGTRARAGMSRQDRRGGGNRGPGHRRRPRRLRHQHRLRAAGQPAHPARRTRTAPAEPRAFPCRRRRRADERTDRAAADDVEDQQPGVGLFGRPPRVDRGAHPAVERAKSIRASRGKARAGPPAIWPRWPICACRFWARAKSSIAAGASAAPKG